MKKNNFGFSIIEVLVGIFIFSLGLVSVYAIITSTLSLNEYSKNSIIATNLARETLESIRNLRDNNYKNTYKWNKLPGNDFNNLILTGVYYKIENNLDNTGNDITFEKINDFGEGKNELNGKMQNYKLCLNNNLIYTYVCVSQNKETHFYRYTIFKDIYDNNTKIDDALKITTKVIWYKNGYHEIQLDSIITDFLRQ
ncbi:prepilin-type N-terminal cleavage/methylation domain-containing protein [Candidatus Gracilibacteria bacterium]|nr:prepilin-type N-terminal cleavage/methylation domain-containing protein [Candidatus Gracilibacteria bacterium]